MKQHIYKPVIAAISGGAIVAAIMTIFAPQLCDCEILYVAQDELIGLEQERIKLKKLEERQLFHGEITTAIKLATTLPQAYQNRTTQVVYSMSAITGKNVKSISKQVHQDIIRVLDNPMVGTQ